MNERQARAILFASLEGGSEFWTSEISSLGAASVVTQLLQRKYDLKFDTLMGRIKTRNPEDILDEIQASGSVFLTPDDNLWPTCLNDLAAPPIGIIAKGDLRVLNNSMLSIVGTRNPTHYGTRIAGDFAAGFADREWVIVSGGAYGIDAAAHKGALAAEGSTIAVLACGVDINYPASHERLFADITETGLLITEVMPRIHAIPSRFLMRNRIIAALGNATIVVEAAFRSGALRTARDAAELLRPVMAVPGPITSPTSEGCHRLIGERVAEVVTSVADAMEFITTFK